MCVERLQLVDESVRYRFHREKSSSTNQDLADRRIGEQTRKTQRLRYTLDVGGIYSFAPLCLIRSGRIMLL